VKQTWSRYLIIFAPLVIAGILLWPTFRSYQLGKEKAAAEASKDTVRINNFIRDNGESYRNAKSSSVKLGLDLQGGMYVMLEVDIVKLIEESALRESVDETFAECYCQNKIRNRKLRMTMYWKHVPAKLQSHSRTQGALFDFLLRHRGQQRNIRRNHR
jgi:SecD/SecF fusion protein